MKKIVKGFVCLVSLLAAGTVRAGVPSDGLATAVADAADNEVIELDEGEYTISAELVVNKPIIIRGAGIGRTIIKTATDINSRMISITVPGAMIENVTVQGRSLTCRSVVGKGVYLTDGTLRNCRVTGFSSGQYWSSGAVAVAGADALVEDCVIDGNTTVKGNDQLEKGGGVFMTAGTVSGCVITNNTSNSGGGVYMTGGTLENSLVAHNKLQYMDKANTTMGTGGGVWNSNGTIAGCTIVFNSATDYKGIGGLYLDGTGGLVERTIVRFNTSCNSTSELFPDVDCSNAEVDSRVSNCCLPMPFGIASVTDLPMFVDAANGDYRLLPGSPCILENGIVIGCKPCSETSPACGFTMDREAVIAGGTIAFAASVVNTAGEPAYTWDFGDGTEGATGANVSHAFAAAGDYAVTLTAAGIATPFVYTVRVGAAFVEAATVAELEAAIAAAPDGQVIRLTSDKVYSLGQTLRIFKPISLEGANGWTNCVLDIAGKGRAIILSDPGAVVRGVTAKGGKLTAYGQANSPQDNITGVTVWIAARGGTFCDSRVTGGTCGNHYQMGHLAVTSADGFVTRCVIDNNNILCQPSSGNGWGGGVYLNAGVVENCLVTGNTSYTGGGACVQGGTLRNCTFYGNHAQLSGGIHATAAGQAVNCVSMGSDVVNNKDSSAGRPEWGGTVGCFANCAFVGVSAAPNDTCFVMADPFENAAVGNFHPLPGSAGLVDKGQDYADCEEDLDLDNMPRKSGSAVDIGCYELDASKFSCAITAPDPAEIFSDETVVISAELINPPAGASFTYSWRFTDRFGKVAESQEASPELSLPVGWYTVDLTVGVEGDPSRTASAPTRIDLVHVAARHLYAVEGAAGEYPYDTPEKGCSDVAALFAEAIAGATVHVGEGTFTLNDEMFLAAGVTISGEGWEKTVLQLKSGVEKRMLHMDHADAVVEKLTLNGGMMNIRSDQGDGYGVSVWIDSKGGTLRDCRVTGAVSKNHFQYGVVAVRGEKGLVTRCLIDGNDNLFQETSGDGYGVLHVSAGVAENCLVTNNIAFTGGGAYVTGGTLRNCTFYRNTARVSGGAKATGGKIVNCVFMGDTSNASADTTVGRPEWSGTGACFENCAFVGIDALPGNSSIKVNDPFIAAAAGDLHPAAGATGIVDKGQDYEGAEADTDFEGKARLSGPAVDIGCYEVDASQFSCSFDAADGKIECYLGEELGLVSDIVNAPAGVTFGYDWKLTDRFGNEIKSSEPNPVFRLAAGWYSVEMAVYNVENPSQRAAASPRADFLHVCPHDLYATAGNAGAAYPWDTPETGSTNVNELVDEAIGGCVIHIGEGTFTNAAEMVVTRAVTITGAGWEKSVIRIAAEAKRRVLRLDHEKAVCEKVTLCGGRSTLHGSNDDGYGGGVRIGNSGGELRDCRVTDNVSSNYYQFGAGISVRSEKGVVRRCLVDNNSNRYRETVQHGGGIDVTAGLVENCLVVSNTSGEGSGISISGGTIRNCTVAFNKALKCWEKSSGILYGGYSGGVKMDGGGKVQNCVFYGNTAETNMWYNNDTSVKAWQPVIGYPEWLGKGSAVKNCAFAETVVTNEAVGGTCVLFAEPGFRDAVAGDFHLLPSSPLVNAGDRLDYTKDDVDLEGNGRITGFNTRKRTKCLPDLGCYESPWGLQGMKLWVK